MFRNVGGSAGVQSSPEHVLGTATLSLSLPTFSGQTQLSLLPASYFSRTLRLCFQSGLFHLAVTLKPA